MSDMQLLFLVLSLIYVWECLFWARRGTVLFRAWMGNHWTSVHPIGVLGNHSGALILASPLPPLGTLLCANQLPLSIGTEGVLGFVATNVNPGWRPHQTARFFRFAEIRTVTTRGKRLLVNGELLARTFSNSYAVYLADRIRELGKFRREERKRHIRLLLEQHLDTAAARETWIKFKNQRRSLLLITNLYFALVFVMAPVLIWFLGLRACWIGLIAGLAVAAVSTGFLFRRAHKALYPEAEDDRFTQCLTIFLSPATAIRACDLLARPLTEKFHPLVLAKLFCSPETLAAYSRNILADLRHPALPLCPVSDPAAQQIESEARGLLLSVVESFLNSEGGDVSHYVPFASPSSQTYCPRCGAQFMLESGICEDCGGIPLVRFPIKTSARGNAAAD